MEKSENIIPNTKLVVLGGANKKRVLATIEYLKQHPEVDTIIFTGGKTSGPSNPSEANEMNRYFQEKFPDSNISVILEEEACDTEDNAEKTINLLQKEFGRNIQEVLLLSDATHLPRAGWAFERRGIETKKIVSEYWLTKRSVHHKNYVKKLLVSSEFLKQAFLMEPILHALTTFEKGRKWIRLKTKKRIYGN